MREGERVCGAMCNPIAGLVKRHADSKKKLQRGYVGTWPDIEHVHLAEKDGDGTVEGKEGEWRRGGRGGDNRFVHMLNP